jgi:hypothetical protein
MKNTCKFCEIVLIADKCVVVRFKGTWKSYLELNKA